MGRFASTVRFYERYREPYPAEFFRAAAMHLGLTGGERLVDIACGPAPLAIGFAPFVGSVIGVDPEARMIASARVAAAEAGMRMELRQGRFEDVGESLGNIDVVTIGRALHWLPRDRTVMLLERLVSKGGWILVGGSHTSNAPINRWAATFHKIRRAWSFDPHEGRYRLRSASWFSESRFRRAGDVAVTLRRRVTIDDLIGRALSLSTCSTAKLGRNRADFERALREGLTPYALDGVLHEEIRAGVTIFQ
jgi:SAM-dependent methyltransferase